MKYKNIMFFFYLLSAYNTFTAPSIARTICYMSMFFTNYNRIKKLELIKTSYLEQSSLSVEDKYTKYQQALDELYTTISYDGVNMNENILLFLLHHKVLKIMEIIIITLPYQQYDVAQLINNTSKINTAIVEEKNMKSEYKNNKQSVSENISDTNILCIFYDLKMAITKYINHNNENKMPNSLSEVHQIKTILKEYLYCTMWCYFIIVVLLLTSILLLIIFVSKFFIFFLMISSVLLLWNNPFIEYIHMTYTLNHRTNNTKIVEMKEDNLNNISNLETSKYNENLLV